jgi:hypothetical protein
MRAETAAPSPRGYPQNVREFRQGNRCRVKCSRLYDLPAYITPAPASGYPGDGPVGQDMSTCRCHLALKPCTSRGQATSLTGRSGDMIFSLSPKCRAGNLFGKAIAQSRPRAGNVQEPASALRMLMGCQQCFDLSRCRLAGRAADLGSSQRPTRTAPM